ncbi:MAG: DNA ligase, partial [Pedobacter sp.]
MSLSSYQKKRSFTKTKEPQGGKSTGKELRFVIQKHAASHLHYDFRLEMGGVLKSWAVPKGPSTDPKTKRLAMMVEDHPYDYKDFEGIIPAGEYGGGTVILWDEGTYEALEAKDEDLKGQEKYLLKELKKGSVKIILHGKKLKGEFALVKTKGMGDNAWLLIKHNDKYANETDITAKDKSVRSKKTLDQVKKAYERSLPKTKDATETVAKKVAKKPTAPTKTNVKKLLNDAKEQRFSSTLKPMLATLIDKPFDDDENWIYEIKWDGYRAVAFKNGDTLSLKSRNDKSFDDKFFPIYNDLKSLKIDVILDGEVVVVDEKGMADFGALQNWRSDEDGMLVYYVFDIIWYDGFSLKDLPLTQRREILKKVLKESDRIKLSKEFETSATEFLEAAKKIG